MTMKAHAYYIIFGRPPIGGSFPPPPPPGGATASDPVPCLVREVTASGVRCGGELAAAVHGGLGVEAHVDLVGKQVLGRRRLDVAVAAPDAVGNPTQIGAKLVHQLLRRFLGEPEVLVVQQRLLPRRTALPITRAALSIWWVLRTSPCRGPNPSVDRRE